MAEISWTFLSNHSHVLICLARDPSARIRDIAPAVHITERAVQRILHDLEEAGIVSIKKSGRRNTYSISEEARLRHPLENHCTVSELLHLIVKEPTKRTNA